MNANERRALALFKAGKTEEAYIAAKSKRTRLSWHTDTRSDYASSASSGSIAKHFGYSKLAHKDYYVYVECTEDDDGKPIVIIRPGGERDTY